MSKTKIHEDRARPHAKRLDLRVVKSRSRTPEAVEYGGYMITDLDTNGIVAEGHPFAYSMDLDEVEEEPASRATAKVYRHALSFMTTEQVARERDRMRGVVARSYDEAFPFPPVGVAGNILKTREALLTVADDELAEGGRRERRRDRAEGADQAGTHPSLYL